MKQKVLKSLMLIALLLTGSHAFAYDFEVDGMYFNIIDLSELTCELTYKDTEYNSYSGDIVIPETVTYKNKTLKVISIRERTFSKCSKLYSVSIPNTIITIPDYVFGGCNNLSELRIEDGETSLSFRSYLDISVMYGCPIQTLYIGRNLSYDTYHSPFKGIKTLRTVRFGNNVTSIGMNAFEGCSNLLSVTIPNSITTINQLAFDDCISLKELKIEDGIEPLNLSFNYNGNWDLNSSYTQGEGLFFDCPLQSIYLGRNLVYSTDYKRGYSPFYGIKTLKHVTIGGNVTSISDYAFQNCVEMDSIKFGNNVTSIGEHAFEKCNNLKTVIFDNKVSTIGNSAFKSCFNLSSIIIGNSVVSIGDLAFDECDLDVVECLNENPPTCGDNVFNNKTFLDAILVVEKDFINKYQNENVWKNFFNLKYYIHANNIKVSSDSIQLEIGQQTTVNAKLYTDDPNAYPLADELIWESDNENVATVSQGGEIKAISEGHCIVSVKSTYDTTLKASIDVYIIPQIPTTFILDKSHYERIGNRSVKLNLLSSKNPNPTIIPEQISYNGVIFDVDEIESGAINDNFICLHIPSSINQLPNDLIGENGSITTLVIEESKTPLTCGYNSDLYLSQIIRNYPNPKNDVDVRREGIRDGYYNGLFYNKQIKNIIINRDIKLQRYQSLFVSSEENSSYTRIHHNIIYYSPFNGITGLEYVEIGENVSAICKNMITLDYGTTEESLPYFNFDGCDSINIVMSNNSQAPIGGKFTTKVHNNATLYIPKGKQNNYNTAEGWKNFSTLKEIENIYSITTSYNIKQGRVYINETTSGNTIVNINEKVVFDIIPYSGYKIRKVTCNGIDVSNNIVDSKYIIEKVTENINLNVTFTETTHAVTTNYNSKRGNITINGISETNTRVNDNDKVEFEIIPASGYEIDKVTCNETDVTNDIIYDLNNGMYIINQITEDIELDVTFVKQKPFEANGVYYNILSLDNKTVEVTYNRNTELKYTGEIIIPENVNYRNATFKVTSIGKAAFNFCDSITSVTIPNSVTNIGSHAFSYCSLLTSIVLGDSIITIGDNAFYDCYRLTSITIPNSVTSIGSYAFFGCYRLALISIPNSVTSIGECAFGSSGLTEIVIPNSITNISTQMFNGCENLISIIIPNSVTSIGEYAFMGCNSLTSVNISNSVTSIGRGAFMGCNSLTSVNISNSVTRIDKYTFSDCKSLTSVVIPNSVTSIGEYAFENCIGLKSLTIGNSVTNIENYAISSCYNLTEIYCKTTNPPTYTGYFSTDVTNKATLYVPTGCKSAYASASHWRLFLDIQEYEFSDIESTLADDVNVLVENENIVINGADNAKVEIYSVNGQCVYSGNATTIPVTAKGLYFVKIGNSTHKVKL